MTDKKTKILIAKPGFDGHDRGAKIVAFALQDAGFKVIYTGLHKKLDQIVDAAIRESVDIIGLSIMSGAHISICEKLLEMMKAMNQKKGVTFIFSTHDSMVMDYARRLVQIRDGRVADDRKTGS